MCVARIIARGRVVFWLSSQTGIPFRCPVFVCGIFGKLWGRGQYHLQAVVSRVMKGGACLSSTHQLWLVCACRRAGSGVT